MLVAIYTTTLSWKRWRSMDSPLKWHIKVKALFSDMFLVTLELFQQVVLSYGRK
jgi:hypothetical protein